MTNLEYIKNNDELLEDFIIDHLAVVDNTGEMVECSSISCDSCLFVGAKHNGQSCIESCRKWLKEEYYKPLYKKGDVIMTNNGHLLIVNKEANQSTILVANNIDNLDKGWTYCIRKEIIKRKFGNIYEDQLSNIAYEVAADILEEGYNNESLYM